MEKLAPYFWDGVKIGLIIAIPIQIIRLIIYFKTKNDINSFKIRTVLQLLTICLGITFAFVDDDDFKK